MTLLKFARDLLYLVSDVPYAMADGLDMAIEQLSPVERHVTIRRFYEESNA